MKLAIFFLVVFLLLDENSVESFALGFPGQQKPGCHRVGYQTTVSIPDCEARQITLNACRGHCLSWTVPFSGDDGDSNEKPFVSKAFCCRMIEYEEVDFVFKCNEGPRVLKVRSAKEGGCRCFDC